MSKLYSLSMSKRLQVLLDPAEFDEIGRVARAQNLTVSEWVRKTLREARQSEPHRTVRRKLQSLQQAAAHSFPTADIDRMLDEIERGYSPADR